MTYNNIPSGYHLRAARFADLQDVVDLIHAVDVADGVVPDVTASDLKTHWQRPGFDLESDAWVIIAPDGSLVGYEDIYNRSQHARLLGDGYVHPEHKGLGLGTTMLRQLEARAWEHAALAAEGLRVSLRNGMSGNDVAGQELHAEEGYQPVRYFFRMETEMAVAPQPPVMPDGIQLTRYAPGYERAVFDALQDGFRDHWGFAPWDYDTWHEDVLQKESFDLNLWFIAWQEGEIAGAAVCRYRLADGWVNQLAVRRAWRRKGLGMALLQAAFSEFYERGTRTVGLSVDAQNQTGATRLYERAGMHVAHKFVLYEKELRPGVEPGKA